MLRCGGVVGPESVPESKRASEGTSLSGDACCFSTTVVGFGDDGPDERRGTSLPIFAVYSANCLLNSALVSFAFSSASVPVGTSLFSPCVWAKAGVPLLS